MSQLRDQLTAAMGEAIADPAPVIETVVDTPAPEAPETQAEPTETPAPEAQNGAKDRDEQGRFAKKAEPGQVDPIAAETPAEPEAPKEPIRIPPSLPAAVKAKYHTLDPDVREAIEKIEETVQKSKAEWGPKGERLNRWDEILAPRREKFQLSGMDEFTAVQTLFAAQDLLERSPVEGLTYLARSYGVDLRQLVPQTSQAGQPQMQQPGVPGQPDINALLAPALQPLVEQVRTLQQQLDGQAKASETAQLDSFRSEVAAFAAKPENLYFENVKEEMIGLLQAGRAQTLAQAYEMATWASPEIRPILLKEQTAEARRAAAEEAQRQKAAQAKAASGSVTGVPGSTVAPANTGSKGNVRADLVAAFGEHAPQV